MAFRDLIVNNYRRKIFALLLAILVWMTIHYADTRHRPAPSIPILTNSPGIYP